MTTPQVTNGSLYPYGFMPPRRQMVAIDAALGAHSYFVGCPHIEDLQQQITTLIAGLLNIVADPDKVIEDARAATLPYGTDATLTDLQWRETTAAHVLKRRQETLKEAKAKAASRNFPAVVRLRLRRYEVAAAAENLNEAARNTQSLAERLEWQAAVEAATPDPEKDCD